MSKAALLALAMPALIVPKPEIWMPAKPAIVRAKPEDIAKATFPFPVMSPKTAAAAGVLDGFSPTGAWSFSRNLFSSFSSSRYAVTGSPARVTTLNDQSGNSRNLTDGGVTAARPLDTAGGPNSKACGRFDTSSTGLSGAAISNFVANNAAWMIFSCVINGSVTLNASATYQNHHLFGDGGSHYLGTYAKNVSGTTPTFLPYTWDGADKSTSGYALTIGTAYVVTLRHDSGTLYLAVNGGSETSVAAGNTQVMTNLLLIGAGAAGNGCDMSWFEGATFSTVPNSTDRTTIINAFKSWVGA